MSNTNEEVYEVLTNQDEIQFEELHDEESSPLNQPVVDKDNGENHSESTPNSSSSNQKQGSDNAASNRAEEEAEYIEAEEVDDAPEQDINEGYRETVLIDDEEEFEIPIGHATQAADSILGIANNVLEVGGGFFVKIKKHKEFYEFEEIIQVIEKQNEKNVNRIKLDDEDKALLRPLLISILKRKAKKLTPEQQLMGAFISIMMKKGQVVMEVKAENEILVERILDIVREEKGYSEQDEDYEEEQQKEEEPPENNNTSSTPKKEAKHKESQPEEEIIEEVIVEHNEHQSIRPEDVLEVAQDDEPKKNDVKEGE